MKYFAICCKMGHQGRGRYQEITFAIKAFTNTEAITQAMSMPGVKYKDIRAIIQSKEITREEYFYRRQISAYEMFKRQKYRLILC